MKRKKRLPREEAEEYAAVFREQAEALGSLSKIIQVPKWGKPGPDWTPKSLEELRVKANEIVEKHPDGYIDEADRNLLMAAVASGLAKVCELLAEEALREGA